MSFQRAIPNNVGQLKEYLQQVQNNKSHVKKVEVNASTQHLEITLDGTALTVGPNARVTIDKHIYDPNRKVGELVISAGTGVLRLVGGTISKSTAIVVRTASGRVNIFKRRGIEA